MDFSCILNLKKGISDIQISDIKKDNDGNNIVYFKKDLLENQKIHSMWMLYTDNTVFNEGDFKNDLVINNGFIIGTAKMENLLEYYMYEEFDENTIFSKEAELVTEENMPKDKIKEYLGWWLDGNSYIDVNCKNELEQPEKESFIFGNKKDITLEVAELEDAKLEGFRDLDFIKINYIKFNSTDLLDDIKEHFEYKDYPFDESKKDIFKNIYKLSR